MNEPARKVVVDAPAKLNLGLEILGRRPSGYHDLVTIFQAISLYDRVEITLSRPSTEPRIELELFPHSLDLGPTKENLVVRAASAILGEAGATDSTAVKIRLRKRIPAGAGLGGGSSDAAAVLLGVSHLLAQNRSLESLNEIAARLGADVPFFLRGGTQLGQGVGERLSPVPPMPEIWWVVVFPNVSLPTSSIFSGLTLGLTPAGPLARMARRKFPSDYWSNLGDLELRNDLEAAVTSAAPVVTEIISDLRALGSSFAQVTGSGSGVFGAVPDRVVGRDWVLAMRQRGWWAQLVRPLGRGCRLRPGNQNCS